MVSEITYSVTGLLIHDVLDPWLGKPRWKQSEGRVTLNHRFESEDVPPVGLKLKVEINSREHFTVYGLKERRFEYMEAERGRPTSKARSPSEG